jgi:hypothetical protein
VHGAIKRNGLVGLLRRHLQRDVAAAAKPNLDGQGRSPASWTRPWC